MFTFKILLKHPKTGRYFAGYRAWTTRSANAWDFESRAAAAKVARELGLKHARCLFCFSDPRYDFEVPLDAA